MRTMRLFLGTLTMSLTALLCGGSLWAQPSLSFNRLELSWPAVTLYVSVKCGSTQRFDLLAQNFLIAENGVRIDTFAVSCPDTSKNCCSSVSLVLDRSGSMGWGNPSPLDAMKDGAKAFVDAMDPDGSGCDEATLLTFDTQVTVDVFMTNDKVLLKQGIDGLVANGGTAVWDAGVVGIQELLNNGSQPCKGVILLTDGEDNASSNTPDDIIALALNNGIRVYTIGLGTGINDADLERIATDTGGKYYKVTQLGGVTAVFLEIGALIHKGYRECTITYDTQCKDGTRRNVDLTLKNLFGCPGTDTKTKSFRAPRDTTTFTPVTVSVGWDTTQGGIALVPLLINPVPSPLPEMGFTIHFDTACGSFLGLITQGFGLAGVPYDLQPVPGGLQFRTIGGKNNPASDTLLLLRFQTACGSSIAACPITLDGWTFSTGCLLPTRVSGGIWNLPCAVTILPAEEIRCQGDIARFYISDQPFGVLARQWEMSTNGGAAWSALPGETRDTLIIGPVLDWMRGRLYRVTAQLGGAVSLTSQPARLSIPLPVHTAIHPPDLIACVNGGGSFIAAPDRSDGITRQWQESTDGGAGWHTASGSAYEDTLSLSVATPVMSGYRFRIIYGDGCGNADTSRAARLIVVPPPAITREPRDTTVCEGMSVIFSLAHTDSTTLVQWQTAPDAASPFFDMPGQTGDTLRITSIPLSLNHALYQARLVHPQCGTFFSRIVMLSVRPDSMRILGEPAGGIICEGDSITLTVQARGATGYQWMAGTTPIPGATGSAFTIRNARASDWGNYFVRITGDCGTKDSRVVEVAVHSPFSILAQPQSIARKTGDTAQFVLSVTGFNFRYQWLKNGVPIPGATSDTLTIMPVRKSDEGEYRVIVFGDCAAPDTSSAAILSVTEVGIGTDAAIPAGVMLYPAYPNPSGGPVTIRFRLPAASPVEVTIFDIHARKVGAISSMEYPAGENRLLLDTRGWSPGMYAYMLYAGRKMAVGRMAIVK